MIFFNLLDMLSVGVAIAVTAILGFVIFFQNQKSITSRSFLFFSISTVLWGIVNYLNHNSTSYFLILWFARFTLFFATWQAFSLFQFFYVFPEEKFIFSNNYRFILVPIVCVISLITLTPFVFPELNIVASLGNVSTPVVGPGIFAFGALAVSLVIAGIAVFIKKTIQTPKVERDRFYFVLLGVAIMFFFILIFNFFIPAFLLDTTFIPLGALFILPFILLTGYAIIRHGLLHIRIIGAELFILAILIFNLISIVQSKTLSERLLGFGVFIGLIIFSILLIRGILREIKQREYLEVVTNELNVANEQLRKLDEQKSDFITIASHQLRTPLSIVKGYISLIVEGSFGNLPDNLKEPLRRVNISNNRLITLVNDLLDLSRIERGKLTYVFQPSSVLEVAEDAYKEMSEAAKSKGLKLLFHKPSVTTFPKVNMDPKKIKEVMINVIDNAIHYTQHGSVTITVSDLEEKGIVRVSIKDTGIGILKEDISSLFKKFSRMENAKQISSDGTGLGLYVAKLIVEDHKGVMWVESEGLNAGSEFIFDLPIIKK